MLPRVDKADTVALMLKLKVGETVILNAHDMGAEGVIVERLNESYVRVKWADYLTPTIHSVESLKATTDRERSN